MNMKALKSVLIDVPVLFIIFARPEQTAQVFEQIKIARPSKLYLYQDGPRLNRLDDIKNISICRKIVEDIDWECKVNKFYQDENVGCDPSEFISQKWMFSQEEYGIVLEDDDVPSQSFFVFCKELLVKYKDDERINIICGMNHLGVSKDTPYSYLFTTSGSIWGWASWKRVIDNWDEHYSFLNNKYELQLMKRKLGTTKFKSFLNLVVNHKRTKKAHYESILGSNAILNSGLNIVPAKNLISNIGIASESTHSVSSIEKLPKGIRRVFNMETHEINYPIKHPKYVIEDIAYKQKIDRILGRSFFVSMYRRIETIIYRTVYGDFKSIRDSFNRRRK